ncbi:uncharacterized protein A4U43_C07F11900 [Asparagus officinalis]|uniref:Uncharacterized protein n=1 Tax=Asparagus officinalis TaxID=4686 RepID=A0A5P1ED76_ASPOF|nr:uncharacterized protein A4U43_C07F11900 [Asparagus officinalis]
MFYGKEMHYLFSHSSLDRQLHKNRLKLIWKGKILKDENEDGEDVYVRFNNGGFLKCLAPEQSPGLRPEERIRIGKELLEAKRMEEENERKRIMALRKAEKEEEKRAREREELLHILYCLPLQFDPLVTKGANTAYMDIELGRTAVQNPSKDPSSNLPLIFGFNVRCWRAVDGFRPMFQFSGALKNGSGSPAILGKQRDQKAN